MARKARQRTQAAAAAAGTPSPAKPEAPPDPNAWTSKDRRYWPAVGAVLAVAAALRLLWLDGPPFQHDEAIYSIFSHNFRDYNFDPTYHGPTLYHILKIFFVAFGDSDFTARLVSVLMGFVTLGLILGPARRWLGDRGALFALILHAISPVMVTYQRRILFDAFVVVLTFGAVLLFQKIRAAALGSAGWIAAWVGLVSLLTVFLATKANSFFVVAMLLSFAVAIGLRGFGPRDLGVRLPTQLPILMFGIVSAAAIFWGPRYPDNMALTKKHEIFLILVCVFSSAFLWEWLRRTSPERPRAVPDGKASPAGLPLRIALCAWLSILAAAVVYFFFFGHGYLWFTKPGDWSWSRYWPDVRDAMSKMLAYWGGQQKAPRLPGRHDFYLPLLIAYELPILIAFIGGVVRASRFRAPFTDLLLWWSFTSWTLYAMANEKVPWLTMHLVAPFALLGGWWLGQLRLTANGRKIFAAAAVVSAAFLLRNVSATNFERAVDNREPMFYAFTSESFGDAFFNAVEIAKGKTGDVWIYNAWPPSWYMRPTAVGKIIAPGVPQYPEHEAPAGPLRFVVCMEADWQKYRADRFPGWHTWTWDKKAGRLVQDVAGAENPHILNWPRLSWSSFQPELFLPWFLERKAEIPDYPPNPGHPTFLTEWSHIPVVVATPP